MAEKTRQQRVEVKTGIPSSVAGIASLVVPGLGQVIIGQVYRGILLLLAMASSIGIYIWRIADLGRRAEGALEKFQRALGLEPTFVILALIFLVIMWLLVAFDAFLCVRRKRRGGSGVFLAVLGGFFVLGWQISEIDVVKMVREAPEALPPLARVVWPWRAAWEREAEEFIAATRILATEEGDIPEAGEPTSEGPWIISTPTQGTLSEQDPDTGEIIPGTTLSLIGGGFEPNEPVEIWWSDPLGNEFQIRQAGKYVAAMADDQGGFQIEVIMPYRLTPPSAVGPQYHEVQGRQSFETGKIMASEPLRLTIGRMIETIFMGMMATFFGIILSIPISFLAARNIMSASPITMGIYYITRAIMNIVRSIEPLIWALIAVVWVGLGPFAGIVALTVHSIAALTKLYSEAIEGIDPGPIEAVRATGANTLQTIMYGVIPQMISPFISFSIYRWDINVRMSTIIGLVGGGGIGFLLVQYIRLLDYRAAGIAVWFIAVTVAILDYVSAEIRARLV
jgi:phosphonate transport system permease protein